MKNAINISLNPSYRCNFRCSFCYLSPTQLGDSQTAKLESIKQCFEEIVQYREIQNVDLYGGEILLLDELYLNQLYSIVGEYYQGKINVISNLSHLHPIIDHEKTYFNVSWDDDIRQKSEIVFQNMNALKKGFGLLMLATPEMLNWSQDKIHSIADRLNKIPHLLTMEIKPYSNNQANQLGRNYHLYEEFIKRWLKIKNSLKFEFINERQILSSIGKLKSSWSDDHLYITPSGGFAVLDFDSNGNELFRPVKNYQEYVEWFLEEKIKTYNNEYCQKCAYLGHCLSEHLRPDEGLNNECSGFRGLLEWYDK